MKSLKRDLFHHQPTKHLSSLLKDRLTQTGSLRLCYGPYGSEITSNEVIDALFKRKEYTIIEELIKLDGNLVQEYGEAELAEKISSYFLSKG